MSRAARATGVAVVFTLSAVAGFGLDETSVRPAEMAGGFEPRPFAMSYAVRQEIERARESRRVALAAEAAWSTVSPLAYDAVPEPRKPTDRFDALVGGTLALTPGEEDVPVPVMRPGGVAAAHP